VPTYNVFAYWWLTWMTAAPEAAAELKLENSKEHLLLFQLPVLCKWQKLKFISSWVRY